jgi:sec-independent protein translocase protein TatA
MAKKLRSVGTDLGAAVRGFKKAVNDGDEEQTRQINDLTGQDAEFKERDPAQRTESKPSA